MFSPAQWKNMYIIYSLNFRISESDYDEFAFELSFGSFMRALLRATAVRVAFLTELSRIPPHVYATKTWRIPNEFFPAIQVETGDDAAGLPPGKAILDRATPDRKYL